MATSKSDFKYGDQDLRDKTEANLQLDEVDIIETHAEAMEHRTMIALMDGVVDLDLYTKMWRTLWEARMMRFNLCAQQSLMSKLIALGIDKDKAAEIVEEQTQGLGLSWEEDNRP